MPLADYNEIIQREIRPQLTDAVVYKKLEPLTAIFGTTPPDKGDRITTKMRLGYSSNAAAYDKSDVNVAPATQTLAKPYWTKVFFQGDCEVHGIDISNDRPGGPTMDMISDAIAKESAAVMNVAVAAVYAQILADVDSSGTAYSDAALSRSTYPLLVSYEETTDTAITLTYFRNMIKGTTAGKYVNLADYTCLMEQAVYSVFRPLASAVNGWNNPVPPANVPQPTGYPEVGSFEGLAVANPYTLPAMTTGTVFMLRKQDVHIVPHRVLEIVPQVSGRDSLEFAIYMGLNCYVDNPYLQGKMLNKD